MSNRLKPINRSSRQSGRHFETMQLVIITCRFRYRNKTSKRCIWSLASKFSNSRSVSIFFTMSYRDYSICTQKNKDYFLSAVIGIPLLSIDIFSCPWDCRYNMNTILRNNKRVRKHFKLIPMWKIGATFDVANKVEFLASNKVIYFTGPSYLVDGGMHCTLVWCKC